MAEVTRETLAQFIAYEALANQEGIERHLKAKVTGIMRAGGTIDVTFGRQNKSFRIAIEEIELDTSWED